MIFPPAALRQIPATARRALAAPAPPGLTLAGRAIALDRGGFHILSWTDETALRRETALACSQPSPVVRYAGGALIDDLTLRDNMYLEPALDGGQLPDWLDTEVHALFEAAGAPLEAQWGGIWPPDASALSLVQVRIGRALAADPDVLLVDAAEWDDEVLPADRFTEAFLSRNPWRVLAWVSHDTGRAHWLGESLQELQA
jgi:hypothetical protein